MACSFVVECCCSVLFLSALTATFSSTVWEANLRSEREQAHFLLDALPDEKLAAVRSLLEVMVEPLSRSLAMAPVEDEDFTPETAAALDRARASLARGEMGAAKAIGIKPVRTSFMSPWQNGVAERFVGNCRRDLLDHVIVLNERHLKRLIKREFPRLCRGGSRTLRIP